MVEIKGKHSEQSIDNVTIVIAAAIIMMFIGSFLLIYEKMVWKQLILYKNKNLTKNYKYYFKTNSEYWSPKLIVIAILYKLHRAQKAR